MIQANGSDRPFGVFLVNDCGFSEDIDTNMAISGYQRQEFDKFFKEFDLSIDSFWRTCLIKQGVEEYNQKVKGVKAQKEKNILLNNLIDQYKDFLIDEIKDLKPNLIIPTGELGLNFFTGLSGIHKFRGSVLPTVLPGITNPTKVLPILGFYPYLNQDYKLRFVTRVDCSKILKHLNNDPTPDLTYTTWIAKNASSLREFLNRSYKKCIETGGFLVFDIETTGGVPTCISFCFDGKESVCVPFLDPSIDIDNRVVMFDLVAKVLADPNLRKVNQNIKYDWKRLENWGFFVANVCGDTMLASSCLYCEFPKGLGFLTSIYTDLPYFKDEGRDFDPSRHKKEQFYLYNAKDSLATHQIYTQQIDEIVDRKVEEVYSNLIKLIPIYRRMEDRGLRVDQEEREFLWIKYNNLFTQQESKLKNYLNQDLGSTINSLSNKQMRNIIFNILGYKKIRGVKTTEGGEPSTDEDSLMTLLAFGEAEHAPSTGPEILRTIISCRKVHKVLELIELKQYPDLRMRCEFNLAGTENGRSSSSVTTDEILFFDEKGRVRKENLGHSFQNIGKHGFSIDGIEYGNDLRRMFIPSPGYVFCEIDLSQAEARVDTILAGNFDLLRVFDDPLVGIHKLTGSWIYDCTPDEIKKNKLVNGIDRYHVAKQVRHAGERNIQANGLVTKLLWGFTPREGEILLSKFHKFQPEIRQVFHREVKRKIDTDRMLIAPNGRFREFFDRIDDRTYNEGFSFLPQAIVSDQMKFHGILKTFSDIDIYSYCHLLHEGHDGVLVEVKKGREEGFAELFRNNLKHPIDFRKCSLHRDFELVIPAEVSYGETWYKL